MYAYKTIYRLSRLSNMLNIWMPILSPDPAKGQRLNGTHNTTTTVHGVPLHRV